MNEPVPEIDDEHDIRERRRAALATILEERADPILERIVTETVRATDFAGLGRTVAGRFATIARASLPVWLTALGAPDHERARIFAHNTHYVREMLGHGIPKFVQRSLVSFGFRLANSAARDAAPEHGFRPDELELELRVFQRDLESRLFYGAIGVSAHELARAADRRRLRCRRHTGLSGREPSSLCARPSRRTRS